MFRLKNYIQKQNFIEIRLVVFFLTVKFFSNHIRQTFLKVLSMQQKTGFVLVSKSKEI